MVDNIEVEDIRSWLGCSSQAGKRVWEESKLYAEVRKYLAYVSDEFLGKAEPQEGEQKIGRHQIYGYAEDVIQDLNVRMKERGLKYEITSHTITSLEEVIPFCLGDCISKLYSLKNQVFDDEDSFLEAVTNSIGDQPDQILSPILEFSHYDFRTHQAFASYIFNTARLRLMSYFGKFKSASIHYRLTARILSDLKAYLRPDILSRLAVLKDKTYNDRSTFLNVLENLIGKDSLNEFDSIILQHTSFLSGRENPKWDDNGDEGDYGDDHDSYEDDEKWVRQLSIIPLNSYATKLVGQFRKWLDRPKTADRKARLDERYALSPEYKSLWLIIFLDQMNEYKAYDEIMGTYWEHYESLGLNQNTYTSHNTRLRDSWNEFIAGDGKDMYTAMMDCWSEMTDSARHE